MGRETWLIGTPLGSETAAIVLPGLGGGFETWVSGTFGTLDKTNGAST